MNGLKCKTEISPENTSIYLNSKTNYRPIHKENNPFKYEKVYFARNMAPKNIMQYLKWSILYFGCHKPMTKLWLNFTSNSNVFQMNYARLQKCEYTWFVYSCIIINSKENFHKPLIFTQDVVALLRVIKPRKRRGNLGPFN